MLLFPPIMVLTLVASGPLVMSSHHVHSLKPSYLDLFQLCDISPDLGVGRGIQLVASSLRMALWLARDRDRERERVLSLKTASCLWLT